MAELEKLLETFSFNPRNPLRPLHEFFDNSSLAKWLEAGFGRVLYKCLHNSCIQIKNLEYNFKSSHRSVQRLNHHLLILNEILPPMSTTLEKKLKGNFLFSSISPPMEYDCGIMDKFIRIILSVTVNIVSMYIENIRMCPLHGSVLLKLISHASSEALTDIKDDLKTLFISINFNLDNICNMRSQVFVAIFNELSQKLPLATVTNLIPRGSISKIKLIITKNCASKFPLLPELRDLYKKHNLEELLENYSKNWIPLKEINLKFQAAEHEEALMILSKLIRSPITTSELLLSGILHHLKYLLTDPVKNNSCDVRTFLKIFLEIKTNEAGELLWEKTLYITLIERLYYLLLDIEISISSMFLDKSDNLEYIDPNVCEDDFVAVVDILHILYQLNDTWYQLFDVTEAKRIFSKDGDLYPYRERFDIIFKFFNGKPQLQNMYEKILPCHGISSFELREQYSIPVSSKKCINFTVTRKNTLNDFINVFNQNLNDIASTWNFTFENEIGEGMGVKREVYAILSQELQKLDIWQTEHPLGSMAANDVGLLPKITSEDREIFVFIGNLLAKAVMEKQLIDVPLSEEFFKQLHTNRHSHLRRDYYQMAETMGPLITQLISFKRQKDIIQAITELKNYQINEIIKNLTFDDGSSIDDLQLNFVFPGTNIEMIENGRNVDLTPFNVDLYLNQLVITKVKYDSTEQFQAIRDGFAQILPNVLNYFTPIELKNLICGERCDRLTIEELKAYSVVDEGYSKKSMPIQYLFCVLASLNQAELRMFLQFTTGRANLPFGGLKEMKPPLTISMMKRDQPDASLPASMTCLNKLFLPEYSSQGVAKEKLLLAIAEGSHSFQYR